MQPSAEYKNKKDTQYCRLDRLPGRIFPNIRALQSSDQRVLCRSETSIGSKIVRCPVVGGFFQAPHARLTLSQHWSFKIRRETFKN